MTYTCGKTISVVHYVLTRRPCNCYVDPSLCLSSKHSIIFSRYAIITCTETQKGTHKIFSTSVLHKTSADKGIFLAVLGVIQYDSTLVCISAGTDKGQLLSIVKVHRNTQVYGGGKCVCFMRADLILSARSKSDIASLLETDKAKSFPRLKTNHLWMLGKRENY